MIVPASGDRIIFLGDSITDAAKWTHYLTSYFHLYYPTKNLRIQTEGRGGSTMSECLTYPDGTTSGQGAPISGNQRYDRQVYAYQPDIVFVMFGHNGGLTSGAWKSDYEILIENYISGRSQAIPVLVGPHPQADTDGKAILAQYSAALQDLANSGNWNFSDTWNTLFNIWTNSSNWSLIGGADVTHPGTAGHIAIAYQVLKNLGADSGISIAHINAGTNSISYTSGCSISGLTGNATGATFYRLDDRLPWAVDSTGLANAVSLIPAISGWQNYLLTVSGLQEGTYNISIDGTGVASLSSSVLAAGWNMSTLLTGAVYSQCQEVLGRIRDMHDLDRITLSELPNPREGVEQYKSNVGASYLAGNTGTVLINAASGALMSISGFDARIYSGAQPVNRFFSIELQSNPVVATIPKVFNINKVYDMGRISVI